MKRYSMAACSFVLAVASGFAQSEDFHRNNITVGLGPAIPFGNSTKYLGDAPLFQVGYGYRFNRWFQADAGFQAAFGAANNQNAEVTDFGQIQGGDHEFMIPLGGRLFIPSLLKRFEFSVGAGTAYLHYSETISQNGFVTNNCYSCTSRGGWGGYGLGNVSYFLDEGHTFRIGTTLEVISAATNGQAVGNVPAIRTTDHWMNVIFQFGMSF